MRRRHEDLRMAFRPCPSRPDLLGTPYNRDWRGYRRAVTDHCVAWSAQFTRHQSLAERTPGGYRTTDGRRRTRWQTLYRSEVRMKPCVQHATQHVVTGGE